MCVKQTAISYKISDATSCKLQGLDIDLLYEQLEPVVYEIPCVRVFVGAAFALHQGVELLNLSNKPLSLKDSVDQYL